MDYFKFDLQLFALNVTQTIDMTAVASDISVTKYYAEVNGVAKWYNSIGALVADAEAAGTTAAACLKATLTDNTLTIAAGISDYLAEQTDQYTTAFVDLTNLTLEQAKGLNISVVRSFSISETNAVTATVGTVATVRVGGVYLVLGNNATTADVATFYQNDTVPKDAVSVTGGAMVYLSSDGTTAGNTYTRITTANGGMTDAASFTLDMTKHIAELVSGEINVKAGSQIAVGEELLTAKGRDDTGSSIQVKRNEGDETLTVVEKSGGRRSIVELTTEGASVIIGGPNDGAHAYKTDGAVVTNTTTSGSAKVYVGSTGEIAFADANTTFTVTDNLSTGATTAYSLDATNNVLYVNGVYSGAYKFTDPTKAKVLAILGQPDVVSEDLAEGATVLDPLQIAAVAIPNEVQGAAGTYYVKLSYADGQLKPAATAVTTPPMDGAGYFKIVTSSVTGTVKAVVSYCDSTGNTAKLLESNTDPVELDFTNLATVCSGAALTDIDVSGVTFQGTDANDKVKLTNVPHTVEDRIVGAAAADVTYKDVATPELDATLRKIAITGTTDTYYKFYTEKKYGVTTYKVAATATAAGSLEENTKYFKVSAAQVGSTGTYDYTVSLYDNGTPTIDLNVACLAGLVVDATGVTNAVSVIVPTQSSSQDAYAVTANVGTVVNTAQGNVTATWTTTPTPTITDSYLDSSSVALTHAAIPLSTTPDETKYYLVTKDYPSKDGNPTIKIQEAASHSSAPAAATAYFTVSTSHDGKTATVTYHNGTGANDISLTGLKTKGATASDPDVPFKINLYGANGLESIVISDGSSTSSTHVDYHVSAKGGTVVEGATTGEDVVEYKDEAGDRRVYKNGVVIDLKDLTSDTYYGVKATEVNGVVTYELGAATTTKPTDAASAATGNYFLVDVTTTDGKKSYEITYHKAEATGAIVYDLAATGITGTTEVNVNKDANITAIAFKSSDLVNLYTVEDATAAISVTKDGTNAPVVNYVDSYKLAAVSDNAIKLADLTTSPANLSQNYKVAIGAQSATGVYEITISDKAVAVVPATDDYFTLAVSEGKVTLEYHSVTGNIPESILAKLSSAIKIDAALATTNAPEVTSIDLTKESVDTVKFAVENLPANVTPIVTADDTVDYAVTYEMIKEPTETATDTITLAKGTGTATTLYYEVKAEGGNETKGVKTVSISKTPMDLSGKTSAQIAEILDATQGYFKVTTDKNGVATVAYIKGSKSPADLGGLTVKVDATAVTVAGNVVVVSADNTSENTIFAVSGLDVGQHAIAAAGTPHATPAETYNETYAISGTIALDNVTATTLAGKSSITKYYTVVNDKSTPAVSREGVLTYTVALASDPLDVATAGSHYFAVKYSQYGVTVTYVNADSDPAFDLATVTGGKSVEVNVSNVAKDVTTIDITDATGAKVNYALTNVRSDITVEGYVEGEDTVTYKSETVLAKDQKITLSDKATMYYAATGVMDETTKKVTVTISEGTETKPDDMDNYFTVKRTVDSETKKVSYDVSYHTSVGGTAYNLASAGIVTVDATGADKIALNNKSTQYAQFAVTGLKGGLKGGSAPTDVEGLDTNDTVSYTTAFAWSVGTYYLKSDATSVKPGDSMTTKTSGSDKYIIATVTETDGVKKVAFDANLGDIGAHGFIAPGSSGATQPATITLDSSVTALDATGLVDDTKLLGVAAGTDIKGVATTAGYTFTVTTAALGVHSDTNPAAISINGEVYVSGAASNVITVVSEAGVQAVKTGTLILDDGETLTGTVAAGTGTKVKTVTAAGGSVTVTFANGEITGITGLASTESVTVTMDNGTSQFTYAYEGGKLVRTDSSAQKAYSPASETSNILDLDYSPQETITNVGTFKWNTEGKYYLTTSGAGETATATVAEAGEKTGTITSGATYIVAEVTNGTGDEKILTLTPATGSSNGLVTPTDTFKGTITVSADDTQVNYAKAKDAGYTVTVTGAKAGSTFTDLSGKDVVTTAALDIGKTIVMKQTKADGITIDKTATYTAAKAGAMLFTGGALTDGTVTVTSTSGTLALYNDSTVVAKDTAEVVVEAENGTIKSITQLGGTENVVVTAADGSIIDFKATDNTHITKTVTEADGTKKVTTIVLSGAGDDVWAATGTEKMKNNFAFDDTTATISRVGYFEVGTNPSDPTTYNKATVQADSSTEVLLTPGKVYIKAENTVSGKNTSEDPYVNNLTLKAQVVNSSKDLVDAEGEADDARVTVTVTGTNKIKYNGSGNLFKADFTGVVAGSEISGLSMGSTVTTVNTLAPNAVITVNGVEWKSITPKDGGGNDQGQLFIYSDGTTSSRIVAGEITTKGAVNSASSNGKITQTLTYTAGSEEITYDGVQVIYAAGVPTSIKGLEKGAKVSLVTTDTTGGAAVTTTVTYEATADGKYVYRTDKDGTKVLDLSLNPDIYSADGSSYGTLTPQPEKKFLWSDATKADSTVTPPIAEKNSEGYFLVSDNKMTVSDQSSSTGIDYKSYDKIYATVTYDGADNELHIVTQRVDQKGGSTGTPAPAVADFAYTVNVTGNKKIVYARGSEKSIAILGAGAGSQVTAAWNADDRMTATLAGAKAATATTPAKDAETITLNGRVYTAGDTSTTVDVRGETVYNGTFLLQPEASTTKKDRVTAYNLTTNTDGTKTTTTADVVYSGTDKAVVKVVNGFAQGLTGLGAGETVTITTTTVDGFGNKTTDIDTYVATAGTGDKVGRIKVVKTTTDGTQYVHYFGDDTQDILASSVTWSVDKQETVTQFDWNATETTQTSYFATATPTTTSKTYSADIASQASPITIPSTTNPDYAVGKTVLQLTTTKAASGVVTITEAKLVVIQSNGTFADAPSNATIGTLKIDASGAAGGLTLPEDHVYKVEITNPVMEKSYKNLSAFDTIDGTYLAAVGTDKTLTVNSTVYTLKGKGATAPAGNNVFKITGDKDNAIETGTFVVKGTVTGSGVPAYAEDTCTKTVTYTGDGDGVVVEFTKSDVSKGGEIVSVASLEAGEKAVLRQYKGVATEAGLNETTTIENVGNVITKTHTFADTSIPTGLAMTKSYVDANDNVLSWNGYQVKNLFDFGATAAGSIGIFVDNTAINKQATGVIFNNSATTKYVLVGATKSGSDASATYTIGRLQALQLKAGGKDLDVLKTSELTSPVQITAPTDGSLTLSGDAVELIKVYYDERSDPAVNPDDPKYGTLDEKNSEKTRAYTINVNGAVAGKTYIGFGEKDTVTTTTNLAKDETLKVGATAATAVEWSAAKSTAAVIYGDGAAKSGTFNLDSAHATLTGKNPAATTTNVKTSVVTAKTTATAARVTFANGAVDSIDYLGDGESVEVVATDANGRITTTTYTAAANGDGTFKVTKVETADGITKTSVFAKNDLSDVTKLAYVDEGATIVSEFDWTAAQGTGYFKVTPGFDKDDPKKIVSFSDVTLEKQTKTTIAVGDYCMKVALGADGEIAGITMHLVGEGGKLGDDLLHAATTKLKGKITMNAPATKLTFTKSADLVNATISIVGAAKASSVNGLKAGDKLTTATLAGATYKTDGSVDKAAEAVWVNTNLYTAGASTTMEFGINTAGTPVVSNGVLQAAAGNPSFIAAGDDNKTGTTDDDKDDIAVIVAITGTDKPIVTVESGKITNISGIKTAGTTVTATVTGGVSMAYGLNSLTIGGTTKDKTIKTITLAAGTVVTYTDGTAKTITTAQDGVLAFVDENGKMTLQSGVLKFAGNTTTAITLTGTTAKAEDDVALTVTRTATATGNVEVTVANGTVTGLKGLTKGDSVKIGNTTYTATTDTLITKTVDGSTAGPATANITAGADIMKASFVGGGTSVIDEDTNERLAGQLNWADVSGRATGYFQIANNKTTVQNQTSKQEVKTPTKDTYTYLVASVAESDTVRATTGDWANVLTFNAISVDKDGKTSSTVTVGGTPVDILSTLTDSTTITLLASKERAMVYDKVGAFKLAVKDLAANSVLTNLVTGDKVTTATLETYQTVTVDTNSYRAGAKNALTIVGEAGTAALLSGTIMLADGETAILSGASEGDDKGSATNDIGVLVTGDPNVIVKAQNGVVSSITGLNAKNATVEIRKYTTADHTKYTTVQYKVLDDDGKMIEMKTGTEAGWTAQSERYKQLSKVGAELDTTAAYKDVTKTSYKVLTPTTVGDFNWNSTKAVTSYINLGAATKPNPLPGVTVLDDPKTIAKTGQTGSDLLAAGEKPLNYDEYYLKVTGQTDAKGVTKITDVSLVMTDANAKPAAVKVDKDGWPAYNGVLSIDGSITGTPTTYAKVSYALPTGTKRVGAWTLNAANVALGSTFTNLGDSDVVNTVDGAWDFTSDGKSFTIYTPGAKGTNIKTVTYTGSVKNVKATVTGDAVTSVKGMTAGNIKIVENDDNAGLVTTVYEWKKVSGSTVLQKTVTDAAGTIKVSTMTAAGADGDIINGATYTALELLSVTSDFDWTLDKSSTGYFKATTTAAAVKAGKSPVIKSGDSNTYIAVALDGTNEKNGEVLSISAMHFDATEDTGMAVNATPYTGTITFTAPTKDALTLDRGNADASIGETARFIINGAIAGSDITGLLAHTNYKDGDQVTTAALAMAKAATSTKAAVPADTVKVNGATYTAGANGKLTFTMQPVGQGENLTNMLTLTSGTVLLESGTAALGADNVYAGNAQIAAKAKNAGGASKLTVAATTTAAGATTFTIGDLDENESFTVESPVGGTEVTYTKSGTTLFAKYATDQGEFTKVYAIGAAKTITSAVLAKAVTDTAKTPVWKTLNATFTADDNDFLTSKYGIVNVNLADFDKRYTQDGKPLAAGYDYIIDSYISNTTPESKTKALAASVVRAADVNWQTVIGTANAAGKWYDASSMMTGNKIAQTIKVAKDWSVNGSDGADIITGASANSKDVVTNINGGAGDDTITGGGATENFTVGNGNDVLKSYTSGKDTIWTTGTPIAGNAFVVDLFATGKDSNGKALTGVKLYDGSTDDEGNPDSSKSVNSVLLTGVGGTNKAVTINGTKFYFGSNATKAGKATFTYEKGAIYYGNKNLTNTLSVKTDTTKATKTTLGDTVEIDLKAAVDGGTFDGRSYYDNISAIDASASGNRLILTAAEKDTTLKGGTYQTTLKGGKGSDSLQGGTGADMFWFESLAGSDTITSFTSKNDAIYLGTNELSIEKTETATGDVTIAAAANNADVTLSNGESTITVKGALGATKAIRFSTDGTQTNTLSYYVGSTKANAANNFAATTTADMKLGTDTIIGADGKTTLTAYDFKSYYIGSSATAKDAVKLSALDEKGKVTTAQGAFSLQSSNLSSIDVLDASGLKAGSSIALIGAATGNCTLKGSASNKTNEKFVISSTGTTVVQNLTAAGTAAGTTIGDVIELAAGIGITGTGTQKGANVIYTLDNGGTLQIDGVKLANLMTTTTAGVTTIKRTK